MCQGIIFLSRSDCQAASHCWNNTLTVCGRKACPLHWHKMWVRSAGDGVFRVSQVLRHRSAATGKEGGIVIRCHAARMTNPSMLEVQLY